MQSTHVQGESKERVGSERERECDGLQQVLERFALGVCVHAHWISVSAFLSEHEPRKTTNMWEALAAT